MDSWTIVKFIEDDCVEAVPTIWILEGNNECYWPPVSREKIANIIKNCELNTCWPVYKVALFRNATYNDYQIARTKATKACETSDLNSDTELAQKRRPRKNRYLSSSSEDDYSSLPDPPKLTLKNQSCQKKKPTEKNESQRFGPFQLVNQGASEINRDLINISGTQASLQLESNVTNVTKRSNQIPETPGNREKGFGSSEHGCSCCKRHINGQVIEKILNQQNILRTLLMDVLSELQEMRKRPMEDPEQDKSFFQEFKFPFTTMEQITELENYLEADTHFQFAVRQMTRVGGRDVKDFIKRIFYQLVTDNLAMQFSWLGLKHKFKFSSYRLAAAIIEAAIKGGVAKNEKEAEEEIKKHLRRARERHEKKQAKLE